MDVGPLIITGFKQFLPAGIHETVKENGSAYMSERKRSLVQIFTDPGGMRTVAVADLWGKDPGQNKKQW